MEDQRRTNMRNFLMMKRNQNKQLKSAGSLISDAWAAIKENNDEQLGNILKDMGAVPAFNFLLSEDQLKRTPLMLICQQNKWLNFIEAINKWSTDNIEAIEKETNIDESEFKKGILQKNFWKFHQELVRQILSSSDDVSFTKVVDLLTQKQTLFAVLFTKIFEFSILLTFITEAQIDKMLDQLYLPICKKLEHFQTQNIQKYLTMIRKQVVWNKQDFLNNLKETELLNLKVINYNFLHLLAENNRMDDIMKVMEKIESFEDEERQDLLEKYFGYFDLAGDTPLDIVIRKWDNESIKKMISKVQAIDEISLSVNCLNNLLENKRLTQTETEEWINNFLDGPISNHGYLEKIQTKTTKVFKEKHFVNQQPRCYEIKHYDSESINTTDRSKVLKSRGKYREYPLLNYLQRFIKKPNLLILHKLFFKSLQRKSVKKFYFSAIHEHGAAEKSFEQSNEGLKQCQNLEFYLNPLLELVCKIEQKEVLEFFFDKLLINYMFITTRTSTFNSLSILYYLSLVNKHFIYYYINNQKDLSENDVNKKIYEKVTDMKEMQKIKEQYNHLNKLIECVNASEKMKTSEEWLPKQIRQFLHDEIVKYQDENQKMYETSTTLDTILSAQQIKKYQVAEEEDEDILDKLHTAERQFKKKKTFENMKKYYDLLGEYKDSWSGYRSAYSYIQLEEDDIEKKMKYLFEIGRPFYFPLVRTFYGGNDDHLQNLFQAIEDPVWKIIVKRMINYREKLNIIDKTDAFRSLTNFRAIISCEEDDTQTIFNFILQNKHRSSLVEALINQIGKSLPFNILLVHKLKEVDEFKAQLLQKGVNEVISDSLFKFKNQITEKNVDQITKKANKLLQQLMTCKEQYRIFGSVCELHPTLDLSPTIKKLGFDFIVPKAIDQSILLMIFYGLVVDENPANYFLQAHKLVQQKRAQQIEYNEKLVKEKQQKGEHLYDYEKEKVFAELSLTYPRDYKSVPATKKMETFFNTMSTSDFISFLHKTNSLNNRDNVIVLLEYSIGEEKKIKLFEQFTKNNSMFLRAVQFKRLCSNPQHTIFTAIAFSYLNSQNLSIFFSLKVGNSIIPIEDKFYLSSCTDQQYDTFCEHFKQVTNKQNFDSRDWIVQKLKNAFIDLYGKRKWKRIQRLIEVSNPKEFNEIIEIAIDYFASNIETSKKFTDHEGYENLVESTFSVLERDIACKGKQFAQLFENVFLMKPAKALQLFNLTNRSLICWTKCLHHHPEFAPQVLKREIKIEKFPTSEKQTVKPYYPMSTYYVHDIQFKKYLIDLMKLEIYFYKQWENFNNQASQKSVYLDWTVKKMFWDYGQTLKNKKMAIFMTNEVKRRYSEIYTKEELQEFSNLIFSDRQLKSIKEVPKDYLDAYIQKYGSIIKNIQNLSIDVIKELIDEKYVTGTKEFWHIVSSCKIQIIDYYLEKMGIAFDYELIKSVQGEDRSRSLLERLCQMDNENFVAEFMKKYEVLDKYGEDLFSTALLNRLLPAIALCKRTAFLKILLDKLKANFGQIVYFTAGEQQQCGFRDGNNLYLPQQILETNHFYEYYFLLKESNNHLGINFDLNNFQERFLFSSENETFEAYDFLPEMKKRLVFLNKVSKILTNGMQINTFRKELLPAILLNRSILNFQFFRMAMVGEIDCEKIADTKAREELYAKVFIMKKHPELELTDDQLKTHFGRQLLIVNKVCELVEISLQSPDSMNKYLCVHKEFNDTILAARPEFFFKNIESDEFLNNSMEYMEGFAGAFRFFNQEENQALAKQYIDACFFSQGQNIKPSSEIYGEFRLKYLLIACLISEFQENGEISKYVAEKMQIADTQEMLSTLAGYFLHQKRGINIGFFWDKVNDKVRELSKGEFKKQGKFKISSNSKFRNAAEVLEKILGGVPDIYAFILAHRNLSYLDSQLSLIEQEIPKDVELAKCSYHLSQNFSQQESESQLIYHVPFQIIKEQTKTHILINSHQLINQIRKIKELKKLKELEKFQIFECLLGDLKFKFEHESFKIVKDYQFLEKLSDIHANSFCTNLMLVLKEFGETFNGRINDIQRGCYSLSDVSGPFPINDDTNKTKVLECIGFYQFCKLPPLQVDIICTPQISIQNGAQKMLSDVKEYLRYFNYEINDDQVMNTEPYKFNTKIYLHYSQDQQKNLYDEFFVYNIISFFQKISSFSEQLILIYNNLINVKYCVPSIIDIMEKRIKNYKTGNDLLRGIVDFLSFHAQLIETILFMVIDDANNIMKVFKGILIKYVKVDEPSLIEDQKPLKLFDGMTSVGIKYTIESNIFTVSILYMETDSKECAKDAASSKLVSRKQFLEMIFESTEFLTDYFLDKNQITTQLVKISQQFSKKLNMTVNCTINYSLLYSFIEKYKRTALVREIDGLLSDLRRYVLVSFDKYLNNYLNSREIKDRHSILMYNKFQSLDRQIPIGSIYDEKEFMYEAVPAVENQPALKEVKALQDLRCLDANDISIKNMYLVQIYKSYFASVVRQGMTFVVGYKNAARTPVSIRLKKKQDIDAVNISEVGFLLLVTNTLPINDEINHSRIIRIFVVDMNSNIYQLSQKLRTKVLSFPEESEDRNISEFVPPIQPNITFAFKSQLGGAPNVKDDEQHKYFILNMSEKREFKLGPSNDVQIGLRNYLKIDSSYNELIENFMNSVGRTHKINLKINVLSEGEKIIFFECLRFFLYDLQSILNGVMIEPIRNQYLQAYVSVQKKQDVFENYIMARKKKLFNQLFKDIEIVPTVEGSSKIEIPEGSKTIKITLKINKNPENIDRNVLYKTIMDEFIARIRNSIPEAAQYKLTEDDDKLMSIVDHLAFADIQFQAIKNALKISSNILPDKNISESFQIRLSKNEKTKIIAEDGKTCFVISTESPDRCFFHETEVISYFLNNQQQVAESIASTRYIAEQKLIEVLNYHQVCNAKLVLENTDKVTCEEILLIHDDKNLTRAFLPFEKASEFKKYFIVQEVNGFTLVYSNYFPVIPASERQLDVKINHIYLNQWTSLVVSDIAPINLNKCPINYFVEYKNEDEGHEKLPITRKGKNLDIQLYLLENKAMLIKFKSSASCSIKFLLENFSFCKEPGFKVITTNVVSKSNMVIENTKFVEVRFRGKPKKVKNLDISEANKKNIVFREPPEKLVGEMQEMKEEKRDVESMVYIVNESAKKYVTRAGEKRIDVITLCDGDNNPIKPNLQQINIFFKHLNLSEIIKPTVTLQGLNLLLEWEPTIRGPYEIFLNSIRLNPQYQLGVCAACAEIKNSKIDLPEKRKICFGEETELMLQLKDSLGNIYTELEENIIGDKLIIDVIPSDPNKIIKTRNENINKYGFKKVKFWVDDPTDFTEQSIEVEVLLNKESLAKFELHLSGQALQERMKKFEKEISNLVKGYHKQVLVSRKNFLPDLFKIAQRSLLTNFSIKFTGEQGIDAGGLKREFYDMIGSEFKKEQNPFFKCIDSTKSIYFINPAILKNKKRKQYMELLGKYLANSILNSYLIGVNFSPVFVKMLYGEEITYEDLFAVLPKEEADRYKYLLKAEPEEFEDLELYFSVVTDRKKGIEIELMEDGKETKVTKENVDEYLKLMTQVLVVDRFAEVVQDFKKGFQDVIKIDKVTKWIRYDQFWSLTIGIKELTADLVINYINFQGGKQMHENWLRRYLKESSNELLQGFLKFASGSSSIDFYQTYKVVVRFEQAGANPKKLPISHTCWKEIIIPCYKSYEIMKQLLTAAFIYCSQGFGLA